MTLSVIVAVVTGIASLVTSIVGLFVIFAKIIRWVDRQKQQDQELADIRHEQSIMTIGILACLKGLIGKKDEKEVRDAIDLIETHLNKQAHK